MDVRGTTRAEDAQGKPTQSHISPSILAYEDKERGVGRSQREAQISWEEGASQAAPRPGRFLLSPHRPRNPPLGRAWRRTVEQAEGGSARSLSLSLSAHVLTFAGVGRDKGRLQREAQISWAAEASPAAPQPGRSLLSRRHPQNPLPPPLRRLGGAPREQKILNGHLHRVIYHRVY